MSDQVTPISVACGVLEEKGEGEYRRRLSFRMMATQAKALDPIDRGHGVRSFFSAECKALQAAHRNIEALIPSSRRAGAAHPGEEGRYLETLIRSFLNKHLPRELEALTGFILRPSTKTGQGDSSRKSEEDQHSTQLDVIIYNTAKYPVYERFEEFAIVPPEGVVAIISVKKTLYSDKIRREIENLADAANLCRTTDTDGQPQRGPSTTLLSFKAQKGEAGSRNWGKTIFKEVSAISDKFYFDQCINSVVCLDAFTVFKQRPNSEAKFDGSARYLIFEHSEDSEWHLGLQFLLTGILSAYYHSTRSGRKRPGFTSFQSGRSAEPLGEFPVRGLRSE